jgi:uncharacterized protein (TIGR02147 family)
MESLAITIYDYDDYRAYLRDAFSALKERDSKYSLRFIAARLGIKANSHLVMVADGRHNLSPALAERLAEFFCFSRREAEFWLALVAYNQAKDPKRKQAALEALSSHRPFARAHRIGLDQFDYYNNPITLALRELVCLPDFKEDAAWIRAKLTLKASSKDIHDAIQTLLRLGLLVRDANKRLVAADPHITSGHGMSVAAIKGYYVNNFMRAADCLAIGPDRRHVGGMTMSISKSTYDKIVDHFQTFLDRVRDEVDQDQEPEDVYQLVMALFPFSKPGKPTGGKP